MALKAIIPSGVTEIVVNGLHQWDYGQELEIHCDGLPATVQVHFACGGMVEADVRSCAFINGVATVSIPDRCIEQTTPITAWVYCINDESGRTDRTITLPIIARAKPTPSTSVPTVISDRYTELVTAINEQVAALTRGEVTAAKAVNAGWADYAGDAENADFAYEAWEANHAEKAESAAKLSLSEPTYTLTLTSGKVSTSADMHGGVYLAIYKPDANDDITYSGVGYIGARKGGHAETKAVAYYIGLSSEQRIYCTRYEDKTEFYIADGRNGTLELYQVATFVSGE